MNKNMNPETKELILMTTIFIIYGAIVMLLAFFTHNYMFLILLAPLAFGQSIIKMFKSMSEKNNISKGMNEYCSKFENFKNLYENVYNELDKKVLNKKRIGLMVSYIILAIGILSLFGYLFAIYYIDSMDYGINSNAFSKSLDLKVKVTLIFLAIGIIALIVKAILPSQKRKYKELYKTKVINQIFKLEGKFDYNPQNISIGLHEATYRNLNFDNSLFNRFEMEDKISRKNKRRVSICNVWIIYIFV